MDREDNLFLRHILDLARLSYTKDINVFSDFLDPREIAILKRNMADLPKGRFLIYGGNRNSERKMICFNSSYDIEPRFPISCLEIIIKGSKFENNNLTHRDFLGALLGLGIERKLLGDIYLQRDGQRVISAFLLCKTNIVEFIKTELVSVGRFKVILKDANIDSIDVNIKIEEKIYNVSSLRLDTIVCVILGISRSRAKNVIEDGKVLVNSFENVLLHYSLKNNDVLSIRGYGKFIFYEVKATTKKGRLQVKIGKYK